MRILATDDVHGLPTDIPGLPTNFNHDEVLWQVVVAKDSFNFLFAIGKLFISLVFVWVKLLVALEKVHHRGVWWFESFIV